MRVSVKCICYPVDGRIVFDTSRLDSDNYRLAGAKRSRTVDWQVQSFSK